MPAFKKFEGTKGLFTYNQLQIVLKSILEDGISLRKAAKEYCIGRSTDVTELSGHAFLRLFSIENITN